MSMDIKEAREIIKGWREQGRGVPSPYIRLIPNEIYAQAKGYIEAHEKERKRAEKLVEALRKIPKILNSIKYDKKEDRHYICGPMSCELVLVDDVVKEALTWKRRFCQGRRNECRD